MENNQDLSAVRIFHEVALHLSFTRAADALGMEKSSVSSKIAQLEARLGVRLLQRSTRRVSLTEAGAGYLEHCRQALQHLDDGNAYIQSLSAEPSGLLRISTPDAYAEVITADLIRPFLAAYPKVDIEMQQTNETLDLIQAGLDLALRAGAATLVDSSLVAREIIRTDIVAVISAELAETIGQPLALTDCSGLDFVGLQTPRLQGRDAFHKLWREAPFTPRLRFSINGMLGVKRAVLDGLGAGLLPRYLIRRELDRGALIELKALPTGTQAMVHILYPSRLGQTAKLQAFIEHTLRWSAALCQ